MCSRPDVQAENSPQRRLHWYAWLLFISVLFFSYCPLLLLGVVYFNPQMLERLLGLHSPLAGWSRGWQLHKSPVHRANRWYKIKQRPPMLRDRSGSIKSYLPCATVQPPLPHSVPVHRAPSNTGKTHQASVAQWSISYFHDAAGCLFFFYPDYCGTFGSFRENPINNWRVVTLTVAGVTKSCFMSLLL